MKGAVTKRTPQVFNPLTIQITIENYEELETIVDAIGECSGCQFFYDELKGFLP